MPTYPLATLAPVVSSTGISAPSYNDVYQSLLASFLQIYGSDSYVAPDSQDGQWIATLATALHQCNQAAIAVFQNFSPNYAQGAGLSSLVKLNGITRLTSSYSTVIGNVVGVVGTVITGGIVRDVSGNMWALPTPITIPSAGFLSVTATAMVKGAIRAQIGEVAEIYNPQLGWQSFVNTAQAVAGAPVETDAALRKRQSLSAGLPSLTTAEGIFAAVSNVAGVSSVSVIDNDTYLPDVNAVPAHSICVIVAGGDASLVAAAISSKKPPGAPTFGDTTVSIYDSVGQPKKINFMALGFQDFFFVVSLSTFPGYNGSTGIAIQNALKSYVEALDVGATIYLSKLISVASLLGSGTDGTFNITSIVFGPELFSLAGADYKVPFNKKALCTVVGNIQLVVT